MEEKYEIKREINGSEDKDEATQLKDNFNFPFIFLTDEEIIEFNEECKKSGIDLKVVPISDYMNLPKEIYPSNISDLSNLFENSFISKIKEVKEDTQEEEKFIPLNQNSSFNLNQINKSKENKGNNKKIYINRKRKRYSNESESEEEEKDENKSNENYIGNSDNNKSGSSISFNSNEIKEGKSRINANKEKYPKKKKDLDKKNQKKKKDNKNIINPINNLMKKVKETSDLQLNEEKKKKELIEEILERSIYLTEEGLKEIAESKHLGLVGDQLKELDLKKKSINQLETLLCDIEFNIKVNKLDPDRKKDINTIKLKKDLERKIDETALKKKMMKKEENKKNESANNQNNNMPQYVQKDIEEIESESSYDENDDLE